MSSGASKNLAILVLAGLMGAVAAAIMFVLTDTGIMAVLFVALMVAILVALALSIGWQDQKFVNTSPRDVSAEAEQARIEAASTPPAIAARAAAESVTLPGAGSASVASAGGSSHSTPEVSPASTATKAEAAPAASTGPAVKASPSLHGQAELAARKGSWKYEGEAVTDAAAGTAKSAKVQAVAAAGMGAFDDDADMSGSVEVGPGTRPAALDGPRDGKADDLKQIKGVGPKMEMMCNALGFYHFDQIAAWTPDEVAWVDQNLEGFKGRVTRDTWVEQAKVLAAGGETEFSKKVEKGGVY